MTLRVVIGVDPGVKGALFVLADGEPQSVIDMPMFERTKRDGSKTSECDVRKLSALVRGIQHENVGAHVVAILEPPTFRQGEAATRAMAAGQNYGILKGVFGCHGIGWVEVTPQRWKKHFGLLKTEKDVARLFAMNHFPSHMTWLQRKNDNGRADAGLIALWAHETEAWA